MSELRRYKELLYKIDNELAEWEDSAHGELGDNITKLRRIIDMERNTRQEPKPDILEALNSMNIQEESQVHNILDCLPNSSIATYFEKYGLTKQDKSCDEKPQCMVCERKARCPIVGRVQCTYFKPTNK